MYRDRVTVFVCSRFLSIFGKFVSVRVFGYFISLISSETHSLRFDFYRNWQERNQMSLESYVYYLIHDVRVPNSGRSCRFYVNLDAKVTIRFPDIDELPMFDLPMRELFYLLDVDSLLYLFTSVLLEYQVLICSSSK